ncbi:MAG: hypothetical protein KGL39_35960 [Patescibacteria group bacterium]|nr:hypothetical protein [Patescibacteria group bacterium]
MTSDLEARCTFTIEYRSKGYVEDAMEYARWILRLRNASPDDRLKMLRELGADVPQSIEDEMSALRVQLIEAGYVDEQALALINRLLEVIAECRSQIAKQRDLLAKAPAI